jgi:hypothetical protein
MTDDWTMPLPAITLIHSEGCELVAPRDTVNLSHARARLGGRALGPLPARVLPLRRSAGVDPYLRLTIRPQSQSFPPP